MKDILVFSGMRYDPNTGVVSRLEGGKGFKSGPVGTLNTRGYLVFTHKRKQYKVHRVAWLMHYGEWPDDELDHINKDKTDNRIDNLRVGKSINSRNRAMPSKSGMRGAHWSTSKNKWRSSIRQNGKVIHLGWFNTPKEAAEAYTNAYEEIVNG